ncbi:hypothetical protein CNR22_11910 [Sphingobacteriaceae bacterium]|nr:hypothetical protein CNR22_11910 [Sphingobacteriaceae bacterium]
MIKSFLNNYFGFTKQQRNGLFVLILISVLLLVIRLVYPLLIKPDPIVLLNLPLIEKKLDSSYSTSEKFEKREYKKELKLLRLFVFDPNTVSFEQLLQLGLKEKTAQIFLKFRTKGFVFKDKTDLQKVYGISSTQYAQLEPYVLIANSVPGKKEVPEKTTGPEKSYPTHAAVAASTSISSKIELNSADSLGLISVNGIGSVYAKRILKYRTMLGGYVSVEQLKEVYGLSEELYEKIKNTFTVDAKSVKKLNLNKDDFKLINKHPYLTYETTKTIFDWRRKTTINPVNLKDIINDPAIYQKLLPYLVFD